MKDYYPSCKALITNLKLTNQEYELLNKYNTEVKYNLTWFHCLRDKKPYILSLLNLIQLEIKICFKIRICTLFDTWSNSGRA